MAHFLVIYVAGCEVQKLGEEGRVKPLESVLFTCPESSVGVLCLDVRILGEQDSAEEFFSNVRFAQCVNATIDIPGFGAGSPGADRDVEIDGIL